MIGCRLPKRFFVHGDHIAQIGKQGLPLFDLEPERFHLLFTIGHLEPQIIDLRLPLDRAGEQK